MSWESECLADDPAEFLRLDVVGSPSNGQTVPALVGEDGQMFYAPPGEVWGYASSVETDPSSRAFRGGQGNLIGGGPGGTGLSRVVVPHFSDLSVTNDFACEGIFRVNSDIPFAGTFALIQKQGSGGIGLTFSGGTKLCGFMFDSAVTFWTVVSDVLITNGAIDRFGEPFHAVVERVGNAFVIRINGILNNSTTITSGLPTLSNSSPFRVHSAPGFYDAEYDEALWYTHAIGDVRSLIHFEATRAINDMSVQMSGRGSFSVNSDPPAVYAFFPYSHDFTTPLSERLSRVTDVQTFRDGSEERTGKTARTRRTLSTDVVILDARARRQFASFLRNNQRKPVSWPISQYESDLTAPITAGDTTFFLDTLHKDFDIGNRLAVFTSEFDYELFVIEDMDDVSVTVTEQAQSDWPLGATVVPCLRAILDQDLSISGLTGEDQEASITANILVEDIVESPNRITPYEPVYTYRGVEAFDPFEFELNDYTEPSEDDSQQESTMLDARTGIFRLDADIETSQPGYGYRTQIEGLEDISKFLGWYEQRKGQLVSLWVPSMQEDFKVVEIASPTATKITITETDYNDEYALADDRVDIALVQDDGSLVFRRILSVAQDGDNEVLTVDSTVVAFADTTEQVCFVRMCRLDADDVMIEWITNDFIEVSMKFREVPKEVV